MTGSIPPGSNRTSAANGGSPGELLPPRALQDWVGLGGPALYNATGNEFLGYLVDLCGLQPGDAVLDVGCGSGRMALPLTGYLNRPKGRYAGFDVSREAIAWCTENISASHPNFDFRVVDVQNGTYNPKGKYKSSDFRFPYPDGSFDVVLLASVFTHMLPDDVKHYLHEIVRVLKPGGRSLITFFLLNEESLALIKEGKGSLNFEHEMQDYRTTNVENPEAAIAYPEAFVRDLYGECGLELREPLRYGKWCGRTDGMSGQDVVIAVKPRAENKVMNGVVDAGQESAGYHEIAFAYREFKLVKFHGSEYIVKQLKSQTWEMPLPIILVAMVGRTKGIFVDVGGNYGVYTILAGLTRADVAIHTFEPFPEAVDLLHQHAALNGIKERVTIHEVALSDSAGQAKLYLPDPSHGLLQTSASLEAEFIKEHAGYHQVEMRRLDSYSFDQPVSVVKIDVEGHEHAVIKGARRVLVEDRPVIFA